MVESHVAEFAFALIIIWFWIGWTVRGAYEYKKRKKEQFPLSEE